MVQKIYQPIFIININLFYFFKILNPFQKQFKKLCPKTLMFFFCKNNEKKGSFVACLIFFHPFLKNFSLPENDDSTPFFVNLIGIILVLGHKSWKKLKLI